VADTRGAHVSAASQRIVRKGPASARMLLGAVARDIEP
jgi:hypothetical protein